LYFESEDEDDLPKSGFSKDGKHQNPQIVLGLLVNAIGFPLGYEIFDGKKFEGHTMLPVIEASKKNIKELIKKKYQFIIGARIKNESEAIKMLNGTDSRVI
jgi:transposase